MMENSSDALADSSASLISSIFATEVLPTATEPVGFLADVEDLVSITITVKDFSNSPTGRAKKYVLAKLNNIVISNCAGVPL